jgi:hypothetical protein
VNIFERLKKRDAENALDPVNAEVPVKPEDRVWTPLCTKTIEPESVFVREKEDVIVNVTLSEKPRDATNAFVPTKTTVA